MKINTNTFTFVGVSTGPDGIQSVRYTNEKHRTRVLEKNGHTNVEFIALEQPERQEDCIDALMTFVEKNERMDLILTVRDEAERLGFVV